MKNSISRAAGFIFLFIATSTAAFGQFVQATRMSSGAPMQNPEWVTQVVCTPDGKELISGGIDGRITFWDAGSGKKIRELTLPAIVLALSISKGGDLLAAADSSGNVSIIDVQAAKVRAAFKADTNIANAAAFSEDGKFIAAGGSEGIVRIASVDGKITSEVTPAQGGITALAFAKEQLVIGLRSGKGSKRSADLWDWQNKKLIRTFDEGPAGMRAISVSPDGKLLAIADYQQPTLLTMIPTSGKGAEISLRVLPDNDDGKPVAIWDVESGKRVALLNGETGARSVAFSPDGQMLATAGENGVMIHEIGARTFAEIGRVDSQTSVDAIAFSPDSKKLVIAREQEPIVQFRDGGTDKLVDPFFTSIVMQVRQGLNSGVMTKFGASTPTPEKKPERSATGGSAIETYELARRTSPADLKTWQAVASVFSGKMDDARQTLQTVMKESPKYGEAQRLWAVLVESKDISKVLTVLQATVKADPGCVSCWRSLGDVQYKARMYGEAVQSYDKVLQLQPNYGLVNGRKAESYGALGLSLMSSDNNDKTMDAAKQALTNALMLRPGEEQYYTNLGAAYYFRGDFDKDIDLLTIARRLRPDHARIYYNLGHAYRYKGDKQNAIDAYQKYVDMGEEGEEARVEKARQFIKELSN